MAHPKVTVVGSSLVGVATALAFAAHRIPSTLLDVDQRAVEALRRGKPPFEEPGMDAALKRDLKAKTLRATSDLAQAYAGATHLFICAGTPPDAQGGQDLSYVEGVARSVGEHLQTRKAPRMTVVVRSAVLPGTTGGVVLDTLESFSSKKAGTGFGLATNPEFLREGAALKGALHPDRIVIGGIDSRSIADVAALYRWARCPVLRTDPATAEMVKYAAGAFLAAKVSLANELANLGGELGVDWTLVAKALGHDERIGRKSLSAGVGFGGSGLPRDLKAIAWAARRAGRPLSIVEATLEVNQRQASEVFRMLTEEIGELEGKRIALLGLAFKPGTDDVRESRASLIAREVIEAGADIVGFDPLVKDQFVRTLPVEHRDHFHRAPSIDAALDGAHAVVIQNESPAFRSLRPSKVKLLLKKPIVVDGRRILDPAAFRRAGVVYRGIGVGKR